MFIHKFQENIIMRMNNSIVINGSIHVKSLIEKYNG